MTSADRIRAALAWRAGRRVACSRRPRARRHPGPIAAATARGRALYVTHCAVSSRRRRPRRRPARSSASRSRRPDLTLFAAHNGDVFPSALVRRINRREAAAMPRPTADRTCAGSGAMRSSVPGRGPATRRTSASTRSSGISKRSSSEAGTDGQLTTGEKIAPKPNAMTSATRCRQPRRQRPRARCSDSRARAARPRSWRRSSRARRRRTPGSPCPAGSRRSGAGRRGRKARGPQQFAQRRAGLRLGRQTRADAGTSACPRRAR